ncbi:MAG TPA: SUMF1/EgtB/PvdO family nonheme iron enzyme [Vicinamibacterales bacterium]|nr:SUMF1/EgtB/PvdO family nonheme iron enzyme [Vicinamibacterales bacterium]
MITSDNRLDRDQALAWYKKNRARSAEIFGLLSDAAYYDQPIALRHPIVFYEGHVPAFSLNTLVKKALGKTGIDEGLEHLFARGIDPEQAGTGSASPFGWPERAQVRAFVEAADAMVIDALTHENLDVPGHPLLDRADAVYTILEHEAMHQETLLYMWHRLPHDKKQRPSSYHVVTTGSHVRPEDISIPGGRVQLGARRGSIPFGWDNEFGDLMVDVAPFSVARFNVTNADFLEFVEAGGYSRPELWSSADWLWVQEHALQHPTFWEHDEGGWRWRGMFEYLPLPLEWPAYVSHAEASAFARWRERRLLTEADYQRLVTPFPAGGYYDFAGWEPAPVGTHSESQTSDGVEDLVGNGWEWTSTAFRPFPGFRASASYPEYSSDFFDESHYVMRGASPVTARELVRPTFRNWFRPRYPYVYATFRLAGKAS